MPIRNMLKSTSFDSTDASIIAASYEEVMRRLGVTRGVDPAEDEKIAKEVLSVAATEGPDLERIVGRSVQHFKRNT